MTSTAYDQLLGLTRRSHLLNSTAGILGWDQETMMPPGGVEHRSQQLSLLAELSHQRSTSEEYGDALARAAQELGDQVGDDDPRSANVRELQRRFARATCLPARLVAEIAETTSLAQHEWAAARSASDFARFLPWLDKLVGLMREKAQAFGPPEGGELWDALADDYEPDVRATDLSALFGPLRTKLTELLDRLRTRGTPPDGSFHRIRLPVSQQESFVRFVSEQLGFDFSRGRLDSSTHPFCGGSHQGDVRMTTRFGPDYVCDALGSTMHETGHGLYEQGLLSEHTGTPLGEAVSLGIHESQSRLWENHVGRSPAFWRFAQPRLTKFFGDRLAGWNADSIYRAANRVEPSLIRVEADEATYDLHVMLRFELEVALIRGDVDPADLPRLWAEKTREFLGIEVPDDRRGCLQDVHWSCGLFGYFPTYTLGNLYAAQFAAAARRANADLDNQIENGEFTPLLDWLRTEVHRHGQRYSAAELCRLATGKPLDPSDFISYLNEKLDDVYRISG